MVSEDEKRWIEGEKEREEGRGRRRGSRMGGWREGRRRKEREREKQGGVVHEGQMASVDESIRGRWGVFSHV